MREGGKRERILAAGAELIHNQGFNNTGLADILAAADIPKGSFYHFFSSKADFGLAVIEHFSGFFESVAAKHLREGRGPILRRLDGLFEYFEGYFEGRDFTGGCPIGNLAQEMGSFDESFAESLDANFQSMSAAILRYLESAVDSGELDRGKATGARADFILHSWEGTIIRMKVRRSLEPLVTWRRFLAETVLEGPN